MPSKVGGVRMGRGMAGSEAVLLSAVSAVVVSDVVDGVRLERAVVPAMLKSALSAAVGSAALALFFPLSAAGLGDAAMDVEVEDAGADFIPLRRSRLSCVFSSVGSRSAAPLSLY